MKKTLLFFVVLLIVEKGVTQGVEPKDWGLEAFHVKDPKLGNIHFYVSQNGIDEEKPLMIVYSGCRGLPTYLVIQGEDKSIQLGTVPPDQIQTFADQYHVAFVGKAGTPFCDTMIVKEVNPLQNLEEYQPSHEYIQKCGMEWDIQATNVVIDTLCNMLTIAGNKIIVVGFSEGGMLAVRLASENKKITHLISVTSGVLNQFYSSIINRRMDAAMGHISHQEAQAKVDSLFAVYKKIYNNPQSTEKWYYGHPYKRWGSFCNFIPLEHLVKLHIPILFVNGSNDRNTPILQADYIQLEFIRLGKDNLTYHVMPGVDHWFYEIVEKDGQQTPIDHKKDFFQLARNWIAAN